MDICLMLSNSILKLLNKLANRYAPCIMFFTMSLLVISFLATFKLYEGPFPIMKYVLSPRPFKYCSYDSYSDDSSSGTSSQLMG